MSDHPVAGRRIGRFQCQVGTHGRAKRADAVLDMRGARAVGGRLGVDDIAAVDPPRAVFGRKHSFAMLAHVDGILAMEDRKSTRLKSSHSFASRLPSSA